MSDRSKFAANLIIPFLFLSACHAPLDLAESLQAEAIITDITIVPLRRRQGRGCLVSVSYSPHGSKAEVSAVFGERDPSCRRFRPGQSVDILHDPRDPTRIEFLQARFAQ